MCFGPFYDLHGAPSMTTKRGAVSNVIRALEFRRFIENEGAHTSIESPIIAGTDSNPSVAKADYQR